MQSVLQTLTRDIQNHYYGLMVHISRKYDIDIKLLQNEFNNFNRGNINLDKLYGPKRSPRVQQRGQQQPKPVQQRGQQQPKPVQHQKGQKRVNLREPMATATVIGQLTGETTSRSDAESEMKTRVLLDSSAEKSDESVEKSDESVESEASDEVESDEESDEESIEAESDEESVEVESEESIDVEESGAVASDGTESSDEDSDSMTDELPNRTSKKVVVQEPASEESEDEDDEPSESEPIPKKNAPKKPAKKKASPKSTVKSVKDLSPTPKTKDHPPLPKGVKFLNGTNLVIFKGKAVAAVTKKGFVPLSKMYTKSFDKPDFANIEYEVWEKDKVNKKYNK